MNNYSQNFNEWKIKRISYQEWYDAYLINAILEVHTDEPISGCHLIDDELQRQNIRVSKLMSSNPW